MFKLLLLLLTLSGLQAVPIKAPRDLQRSSSNHQLLKGFRQAIGHSDVHKPVPDDFRQVPAYVPVQRNGGGWVRVEEPSASRLPDGFRQGTERSMAIPDGFRQGTERSMAIPDDFRQGTERSMAIPDGFRQGTERSMAIPDDFRQGTERFMAIPDGFRQGTERFMAIPDGFRQGTERSMAIPDGFRQGTERSMAIPDGFRQGTERSMTIPEGFRQGTEPSTYDIKSSREGCRGEIINEKCYEFNPTPLSFDDAQAKCRALAPKAELASVISGGLHSSLVSLVTKGGNSNPVLTWLGAIVRNQQASWLDRSEWSFSDWMPGHPNIHTEKPACVEMFKLDQSWWTTADCELKRASICSYPVTT